MTPSPRCDRRTSAEADTFALGSTSYSIMTCSHPYKEVPDDELYGEYEQLDFPVSIFITGEQVFRC